MLEDGLGVAGRGIWRGAAGLGVRRVQGRTKDATRNQERARQAQPPNVESAREPGEAAEDHSGTKRMSMR